MLVSIFPDDGVKYLTAVHTSPPAEGSPGFIIFLFDHTFPASMAFHGNLLQGMLEGDLESRMMHSLLIPSRILSLRKMWRILIKKYAKLKIRNFSKIFVWEI